MSRIPVWFDTDMGVDDAAALLVLGQQKDVELAGVSAVAGNVELSHTCDNARKVSWLMGLKAPVYRGAEKPLFRELVTASGVHGPDGLGGVVLPPSAAPECDTAAWDALYEAAAAARGELQVVAVGPLTNLALAFSKYPALNRLIKRVLLMGGAVEGGNITPCAEFNILADPEAAEMVFKSGVPIVMCGLDVTEKAYLTRAEAEELGSHDTPVCHFFRDATANLLRWHEAHGDPGLILHDACPGLFLTCPDIFRGKEANVYVETRGRITTGKTVTDLWSDTKFESKAKNAFVVLDVDRPRFVELVRDALLAY